MDRQPKTNARAFDIVAAVILLCLFAKGYIIAAAPRHYGRFLVSNLLFANHFEIGVLALASFVAVFYSFRAHTRLSWLFATPLFVAMMPVFGNDIYMRLNRPAGEEEAIMIRDPAGLLICYVGFLICWLLVRRIGWRLQEESGATVRDQMSIQELMAINTLAAVLLFAYRKSVQPSDFHRGDLTGANTEDRIVMLVFVLFMFLVFCGAILGTLSRYTRWVAFWVLVPGLLLLLIGPSEFVWLFGNNSFLFGLAPPLLIVLGACFVARQNGYRTTRRSQTPAAADELTAPVDQSS